MQQRVEIHEIGLYNAIKQVKKGCLVYQARNPDNRKIKGNAQWTPLPDLPMQSVAMEVFSIPKVNIGNEVFDCVVVCAD